MELPVASDGANLLVVIRWKHVIISAYGFWLPNDPRGSWSDFVGAWELRKFGPATKTSERRSLAHDPHNRAVRLAAKQALKFPPVRFDDRARESIAQGFAIACSEAGYICHACCIGHDHAHLVLEAHARTAEVIAGHLKSKATMQMTSDGTHPLQSFRERDGNVPTPWSAGCWKVFIDNVDQLRAAVYYVDRHPGKEELPFIAHSFVTPLG